MIKSIFQTIKRWILSALGVPQTFRISGRVTELPLNGVARIDLTGDATRMTLTAADGTYSFDGLLRGAYVLTPSLSGHTFTPSFKTLTLRNVDIIDADFVDPTIKPNPWLGLQASQWRGGVRR